MGALEHTHAGVLEELHERGHPVRFVVVVAEHRDARDRHSVQLVEQHLELALGAQPRQVAGEQERVGDVGQLEECGAQRARRVGSGVHVADRRDADHRTSSAAEGAC